MPNSYFQFKQFTVHQEHCAMKVCTDACLFGAWVGHHTRSTRTLDIGTGTGLLSLMMAQQHGSPIDAIEIDGDAAAQARLNFASSPWKEKERLTLLEGDAKEIVTGNTYDLILSNPPFFENDLKSSNEQRNLALHSSELGLRELLGIVTRHLSTDGIFAVLLPWRRREEMVKLASENGLSLLRSAAVQQTTHHDFFRVMFLFTRTAEKAIHEEISIKTGSSYSEEFVRLLHPYYLHL